MPYDMSIYDVYSAQGILDQTRDAAARRRIQHCVHGGVLRPQGSATQRIVAKRAAAHSAEACQALYRVEIRASLALLKAQIAQAHIATAMFSFLLVVAAARAHSSGDAHEHLETLTLVAKTVYGAASCDGGCVLEPRPAARTAPRLRAFRGGYK